jgi:ribosomal protein S18 acetylase RimI-like enzyme
VTEKAPELRVEAVEERLPEADLNDLCDTTDAAIEAGGGFGWVKLPARDILERYWAGVILIPERMLFVARLDGVIAGSAQLVRPPRNNEAQAHAATIMSAFIAPWARGHGLAKMLAAALIEKARSEGFRQVNLDVRETQTAAIALYEQLGFTRWGTNPRYAWVNGAYIAGHFYSLALAEEEE